jgi:hypothetical protein
MEAVSVGSVPAGGLGDAGGGDSGGSIQNVPQSPGKVESRQGRSRPGDFAARMEALNNEPESFGGAPSQQRRATREEDPSVTERELALADPNEFDDTDLATVDPNEEDVQEAEYTDPLEVAKNEYMAKLVEHLERGRAPMDLLSDLVIEKKLPNGRTIEVTLGELDRSYLRQNDYTRKLTEARRISEQGQHILNVHAARNRSWQSEDQMFNDIVSMGLGEALDRLVYKRAEALVRFRELPAHEKTRIREAQIRQQERSAYENRIRQLEQSVNRPSAEEQEAEVTRHFQNQLAQLLPAAFKRNGLLKATYPTAKRTFLTNLKELYTGGPVTAELVDEACKATRAELDDMAWDARQALALAPRGNRQGLPPRALSGNAGPSVQGGNGRNKRGRPSDFASRFNSSGM